MTSWRDTHALSVLYDTLLFAVMVSLSAALLLPAVTSSLGLTASLETHRQIQADDLLATLLTTRPEDVSYRFCGSDLDATAEGLGVDTTSPGLYAAVHIWVFDAQYRHEPYTMLLAHDLLCQLQVPSMNTSLRLNPLATDFHAQLTAGLTHLLTPLLRGRYAYNLSASWHPLKGLGFGGSLYLGPHPPVQSTYTATRQITIPLPINYQFNNTSLPLTRQSLTTLLTQLTNDSTRPEIMNITSVLDAYDHHLPPYNDRMLAKDTLMDNLSHLIDQALVNGVHDATNTPRFPGVLAAILDTLLEPLKRTEAYGGLVSTIDQLLTDLNSSARRPLSSTIQEHVNQTFAVYLHAAFPSFNDTITAVTHTVLNQSRTTLHALTQPVLSGYTDRLLTTTDSLTAFHTTITSLLLDQLCLTDATITLTLWPEHP